jgi:hypothetical protein
MRIALVIALALATPALAAEAPPPGAQPGLDAVLGVLESPANARFRRIRVNAAGDVCALVSTSAGAPDVEVLWTRASGKVWAQETPAQTRSDFAADSPALRRSTARADYRAWKACQRN